MSNTGTFEAGLDAFRRRDFDRAQEVWAPLIAAGEDTPVAYIAEYRYATGDVAASLDLAKRRGIAGTARPSASVQYARALFLLEGADHPVVIPALARADEDGDTEATAWLAEALEAVGDSGAAGRMWRKSAQKGYSLGVRRAIDQLRLVDPEHPEIQAWLAIAQSRGIDLSPHGTAFGAREFPETLLTRFIRGEVGPEAVGL